MHTDSLEEKFKELDISGHAKLSIIYNDIGFGLGGSAMFFKQEKKSERSVKVSLVHKALTTYEKVAIDSTFKNIFITKL